MHTRRISAERWNLYALGTRLSPSYLTQIELEYWATDDERVLGLVAQDRHDLDFSWLLFLRDEGGRFRAVELDTSLSTASKARTHLRAAMTIIASKDLRLEGAQGDDLALGVDLLTPVEGVTRHPYFEHLLNDRSKAPARAAFREIGPWLSVADPHFVREFQTNGFDQRLWEIYLWCALRDARLDLMWLEAPDLLATSPMIEFALEATTVAPSTSGPLAVTPPVEDRTALKAFLADFMPMKFGSSLVTKLNKVNREGAHYWEREHAQGKPFLIAIADFHRAATPDSLGSMTFTQSALWTYLYGLRVSLEVIDGAAVIQSAKIAQHSFAGKIIPSGFFDLPGAENVSGVLFSNAGTLAKFDRMGALAGFAYPGVSYVRGGLRHNPAPDATSGLPFSAVVAAPYTEGWCDELQLFHNPKAKVPLDPRSLPAIAHHTFVGDDLISLIPPGQVLTSMTACIVPRSGKK